MNGPLRAGRNSEMIGCDRVGWRSSLFMDKAIFLRTFGENGIVDRLLDDIITNIDDDYETEFQMMSRTRAMRRRST